MADFDVGDVVRLGCVMKFDELYDIVNVYHIEIIAGAGWAFAAATASIQAYVDLLYDSLTSFLPTALLPDRIQIKNMTQATIWGAIAWGTWAGGEAVDQVLPLQVCCLGYGRTSISRVQIRKYFGPFTEGSQEDAFWTAAVRVACNDLMDDHIVNKEVAGSMTVKGCAYRPLPARVTFALTAATSAAPVIQRRRRPGRGS